MFGMGFDAIFSGAGGIGMLVARGSVIRRGIRTGSTLSGVPLLPNPFFVENGHDSTESHQSANYISQRHSLTQQYLKSRIKKTVAGTAAQIAGSIGSMGLGAATGGALAVNAGSIAKHGMSTASSLQHIAHLKSMAQKVKGSEYLSDLLNHIIIAKTRKAGVRSAYTLGSIAGGVTDTAVTLSTIPIAVGLNESLGKKSTRAAQEIH